MSLRDLHDHTIFSDGRNSPEEMVQEAIARGLETIGFSDHSYTAFDESWCMKQEDIPVYRACIGALKERCRDRINVLCGIEQDFYSEEPTECYDYVIGSVHYIRAGEDYIPVDESPEILLSAAEKHFGGDLYALIEEYYRTASYPSLALRDYIRHKGGSFLLSSDSHAKENLCFQFAALESESKR